MSADAAVPTLPNRSAAPTIELTRLSHRRRLMTDTLDERSGSLNLSNGASSVRVVPRLVRPPPATRTARQSAWLVTFETTQSSPRAVTSIPAVMTSFCASGGTPPGRQQACRGESGGNGRSQVDDVHGLGARRDEPGGRGSCAIVALTTLPSSARYAAAAYFLSCRRRLPPRRMPVLLGSARRLSTPKRQLPIFKQIKPW